jgi:pyruvate, water dikinase
MSQIGILPQVTMNRGSCYNIQITEKIQELTEYCQRVKPKIRNKVQGTKLFAAKQILSDLIEKVNWKGKIKPYVDNNLLIDAEKINNRLIPLAQEESLNLARITSSDLRMKRVIQVSEEKISEVYNIEVEDNHNYVVFTKLLTPILVGNCHAAIVSRELGIPCVVGTKKATEVLKEGQIITVDGTNGKVYSGESDNIQETVKKEIEEKPQVHIEHKQGRPLVKVNCDLPDVAQRAKNTGAEGVGLVRIEFIIAEGGIHPAGYLKENKLNDYSNLLAENIGKIAEAFKDKPVWIRTSDIRTDEYRSLKGAENEPKEDNPMLGWHGIRRSLDQPAILEAEFKAIKILHDHGYKNVGVMIPFVIRVDEIKKAKEICRKVGLEPQKDVEFGVMIETPGACMKIEEFCKEGIDFISFGTNDLTQLTLGIDRNNEALASRFSELHTGVLKLLEYVIEECKKHNVKTSICGQAASNPRMAKFLMEKGISSISANIDAVQEIMALVNA